MKRLDENFCYALKTITPGCLKTRKVGRKKIKEKHEK